jgi:hypothetical protein
MMQAISSEEFLEWAAGVGIGFDERFADAQCLGFLPPRDHARYWLLPDGAEQWPHFLASVINGLERWSWGFLWPRSATWPMAARSASYNERIRDVVLRAAGIPDGWPGAIRVERAEKDTLLAVLFVYLAFGWRVDDNLYFVPDHGLRIVQTDHYSVVHVACDRQARVLDMIGQMSKAGYELPSEPPDPSFLWPDWMGEEPADYGERTAGAHI